MKKEGSWKDVIEGGKTDTIEFNDATSSVT